jgi:hypothetical protein
VFARKNLPKNLKFNFWSKPGRRVITVVMPMNDIRAFKVKMQPLFISAVIAACALCHAAADPFTVEFSVNIAPGIVDTFEVTVHPEWAPLGAARFKELVDDADFFKGVRFFRTIKGFMTQASVYHTSPINSILWSVISCLFVCLGFSLGFPGHPLPQRFGATERSKMIRLWVQTRRAICHLQHLGRTLEPRRLVALSIAPNKIPILFEQPFHIVNCRCLST